MTMVLSGQADCPQPNDYETPPRWRLEEYVIVHLETAESDLSSLERHLCTSGALEADEWGICQPLPRLDHRNRVMDLTPPPSWDNLW